MAGADNRLGGVLALRLARFGAIVVAIGKRSLPLRRLAERVPDRIDTLPLGATPEATLAALSEIWGDEALHLYIDAMPMGPEMIATPPAQAFAVSAALSGALTEGMRVGRARAVIVHPARQGDGAEGAARSAGYRALIKCLAADAAPARVLGLRLDVPSNGWSAASLTSAGDAALMLCHPVSRGLTPGRVIDWGARADPKGAT